MKTRMFTALLTLLLGFAIALPGYTEEAKEAKDSKEVEKPKVSNAFLARWKTIQKVSKQKAFETQQTRTVAGVRGAEAEDAILDQLYYKGGVRYPSRVDLKNAITQLTESIKADPKAESVPEMKFFIAQCHAQLGENDEATAVYKDLAKNYADTDWATQAKTELENLSKK